MIVFKGISQILTCPRRAGQTPFRDDPEALGLIEDAALVIDGGQVVSVGPSREAPGGEVIDLGGVVVMPGLVDPHTHLVYGGDRARDFVARSRGESYEAIARGGGGIQTTVAATREASVEELLRLGRGRLSRLLARGVTTVEVKSGYGLSVREELKQLEVIRRLGDEGPQRIVSTLLLHMVPPEWREDRAGWVDAVRHELLGEAWRRRLADHVDVFCETIAFTPDESQALLSAALSVGFEIKAHVDQRSATGFGARAARMGALSLEHLEHADEETIDAMAQSETRAVLLPTASLFLGDAARPPVAALREAGVPMALATDLNPGTSPTYDPWFAATLGCTWYGLRPVEALRGLTIEAALALGLEDGTGSLTVGAPADFLVTRARRWEELLYGLGHEPVAETWIAGQRRS